MTPKFLLPCTAWLTTFHALPRSDNPDLNNLGSTHWLLTRKTKAQDRSFLIKNLTLLTHPKDKRPRSIFLSQEPHFVYSPEKAKAQDRSFLVKNLTLFTHPKDKSPRSIFLSQEPHFVYSPERQKPKIDLSQSRALRWLLTQKQKLKIDLA